MSSLLFKGQHVPSDEKSVLIIDSNPRMDEIFESQREEFEKKNQEKRERLIEEFVESLDADEDGYPILPTDDDGEYLIPTDPNGFPLIYIHSDGSLAQYPEEEREEPEEDLSPESEEDEGEGEIREEVEEPPVPEVDVEAILAEANQQAEAILAEAQLRAKETLDQANVQAEAMKSQALSDGQEEGHKQGYDEGFEKGHSEASHEYDEKKEACDAEVTEIRRQMEALQSELAAKEKALLAEVEQARADVAAREEGMEARLVDVICDVIDKMFAIEFSDKKEILQHIVDHVVTNNPGSHEYLIRVNEENYAIVDEKRSELKEKVGQGVELDIIKDPLLTKEQCMIETDGGVFDCGIDVQLKNLLKDLRALSLA